MDLRTLTLIIAIFPLIIMVLVLLALILFEAGVSSLQNKKETSDRK